MTFWGATEVSLRGPQAPLSRRLDEERGGQEVLLESRTMKAISSISGSGRAAPSHQGKGGLGAGEAVWDVEWWA